MSTPAAPGPEARLGQIIDERYRLVDHIASGGMASVYRAQHVINGSVSAIKVLHPDFSGNDEMAARFMREVQAYRTVQHAHVVSATDFGRLGDGCLYMVLEFIRGQDLCELLYRTKPLDQVRAVKIGLQVTLALVAAHNAGVVHRDLKPDNIMLVEREGDPDYVKVVDFGIAKMAPRGGGRALTALGSVFGTPDYMAPEQARGTQIDHRSDLYTLGTVIYEMLAGKTPFASDNVADVILAQVSKSPPPLPAAVDPELAELVMQLLMKDPQKRVQTSIELAERLRRILERLAPGHPTLFSAPVGSLRAIVAQSGMGGAAPAPEPAAAAPAPALQAVAPMPARVVEIAAPPVAVAAVPAQAAPIAPPAQFAPPAGYPAQHPAQPLAPAPQAAPVMPAAGPLPYAPPPQATKPQAKTGLIIALIVVTLIFVVVAWVIAKILLSFL